MLRREFIQKTAVGGIGLMGVTIEGGCDVPPWVITAQGIAAIGVDIADQLVDAIDPALKPFADAVDKGFNAVLKVLNDIETALKNGNPTNTLLQNLAIVFAQLQTDAAALLAALPGSGSVTDIIVTAVIGLLAQAISELGNLLPAPAPASLKSHRGFPASKGWKKNDFKSLFDNDTKGDPRFHKI